MLEPKPLTRCGSVVVTNLQCRLERWLTDVQTGDLHINYFSLQHVRERALLHVL